MINAVLTAGTVFHVLLAILCIVDDTGNTTGNCRSVGRQIWYWYDSLFVLVISCTFLLHFSHFTGLVFISTCLRLSCNIKKAMLTGRLVALIMDSSECRWRYLLRDRWLIVCHKYFLICLVPCWNVLMWPCTSFILQTEATFLRWKLVPLLEIFYHCLSCLVTLQISEQQ